jgi:hypothetical protein
LKTGERELFIGTHSVTSTPHQVVEDGYEFFAKRQLVTLFSAPNYCGEFDNAGAMMSVDDTLMCSFQVPRLSLFLFYSAPPLIFYIGPCEIL